MPQMRRQARTPRDTGSATAIGARCGASLALEPCFSTIQAAIPIPLHWSVSGRQGLATSVLV
jgi:hypothetical protein